MSERLASSPFEYGQKQIKVVQEVGHTALAIVNNAYGTGFPDFCAGELSLGNHNGHHGFSVGEDTARLNEAEGFNSFGIELGRSTGNAHDLVQKKGRGIDEGESAEWAEENLRRRGISPVAAKLAGAAILGTQPLFDQDGLSDQTVNHMEFDSKFAEVFAKSVASADLGELFTPLGPLLAHKLYGEIQGVGALDTPEIDGLTEFSRKQVVLNNRYQYPLGSRAEKLFATHKAQVMRYMEFVYDQCLRGDLESWDQLMAQDEAFRCNPDMKLGQAK